MLMLAVQPKDSVNIGASATFFKGIHFLFPKITSNVLVTLMDFYFKRAKPIPTSDGILYKADNTNTGIDGGWRSPHPARNAALIGSGIALAFTVGVYLFTKNKKTTKKAS